MTRGGVAVSQRSRRCFRALAWLTFSRLLKGHDGGRLKTQVSLEVLRDLPHESLEGQLADEQLRRLLIATDFAECYSAWAEAVGLLDTAGDERLVPSGDVVSAGENEVLRTMNTCLGRRTLRCELLARSLAPRRLPRSLLSEIRRE